MQDTRDHNWNRELEKCMLLDARRLAVRIRNLRELRPGRVRRETEKILARIRISQDLRQRREQNRPRPAYPDDLPVVARREELLDVIGEHQVVIVAGETGSGKTTQLPKLCLELGRGIDAMIGVTQPRRIAATSVAGRVANELETSLGNAVGYQIRFDTRVRDETFIKFMTDGVLLAEIRHDRDLHAYDTIILDEAHERSLNVDFLLGYLHQLITRRKDLKIIVSSATLDVQRFSKFFADAPVVRVEGRGWPVETRYQPLPMDDADLAAGVRRAVREIMECGKEAQGDILVFLSTEQEIRELAETLASSVPAGTEILPLFGRLPANQQQKVFSPGPARRVILCTNVAETSVTVPRVRYVVDSGFARIRRFQPRTQVERLHIERVSRASLEQRAGRCGRLGPGVCVRLFSEEDMLERPRFTDPEIKRTSLGRVILQMKALGLGGPEAFPFIDRPQHSAIRRGYDELVELGALDAKRRITARGRRLARLPVEPRYGRMLLEAATREVLAEALVIVAGLDIQEVRERPFEQRDAADAAHSRFLDPSSDFLGMLGLWHFLQHARGQAGSNNKFRRFCRDNFISYRRVREWMSVRDQLAEAMAGLGFSGKRSKPRATGEVPYDELHKSLLAGLVSRIGMFTDDRDFRGAGGTRFQVWPGSGLFRKYPRWLMAAELVETRRLYARGCARIAPEWAEEIAPHLCRRTYLEPHWDGAGGVARAFMQVTVFGLPIIPRRRVHYGLVNPGAARKLLIREGLVRGDLRTRLDFFHHNLELMREVESLEHKGRRRGLAIDRDHVYAFYDQHVPEQVHTLRSLEQWAHKLSAEKRRKMYLKKEDLLLASPDGITPDRFPPEFRIGSLKLPLSYRFAPGEEDDGVTCRVPVGVIAQLDSWRFRWLVPGLLGERVALLLRGLPRKLRKNLVPIPDSVQRLLPMLTPGQEPLDMALARAVRKLTGIHINPELLDDSKLPQFLCMRFVIIDRRGKTLASGRDLDKLRMKFRASAADVFTRADKSRFERRDITCWDFEDLPKQLTIRTGSGEPCIAFPGLQDCGSTIALRVFDSPEAAAFAHRSGVRRLLCLELGAQCRNIIRGLPLGRKAEMIYGASGGSTGDLKNELMLCVVEHLALQDREVPRTAADFAASLDQARQGLFAAARDLGQAVDRLLITAHDLHRKLGEPLLAKPVFAASIADLREQLERMVHVHFLRHTPLQYILRMPRFLQGALVRLERLRRNPARDRERMQKLRRFWEQYVTLKHRAGAQLLADPEFLRYRWLLEEYRLALFAQELGTHEKVSPKRLEEQWKQVETRLNRG